MQGLIGLLWLSPEEPNILDKVFGLFLDGRFVNRKLTADNQWWFAVGMMVLLIAVLVYRSLRERPALLDAVAPGLPKTLDDPRTVTWANRIVTGALVIVAVFASANYFYGTRNNGTFVHRWDAFHTVLGVKYHPELGYFDLYKCAWALDHEGPRHFRSATKIRDLRTRKHIPSMEHIAGNDCKERFTPERLEEFKADLDEFGKYRLEWTILFKDKGFNGTPFYATVCKLLVTNADVNVENLQRMAAIDPFLMMIGFGFLGWAFGPRKAAITAIFFCCFFPNSFVHMGGSILRFDYVASLLIGFAALKKDRWGLAGGMFAYASMIRVFPAIFAVGVGVKVIADVVFDRQIREEHWKFAGWFVGMLALFFVISLIGMDGGFENWRTWGDNMKIHNRTSASYRIGFKHLFMLDGKITGTNYGAKQKLFFERQAWYWFAVACLYAPLLGAVRRLDTISFAALFGVIGFFLLAIATRYYYGVVAILFLVDRDLLKNRYMLMLGALLFFITAFDIFYWDLWPGRKNKHFGLMYNTIIGVQMTFVIAVIGSWLIKDPSLLDLELDPRLPRHVPAKLGAVAAEVPPAVKKKQKKKKAKAGAEAETGEDEAGDSVISESEIETDVDHQPHSRDPDHFDPQAVTVPDVGNLIDAERKGGLVARGAPLEEVAGEIGDEDGEDDEDDEGPVSEDTAEDEADATEMD